MGYILHSTEEFQVFQYPLAQFKELHFCFAGFEKCVKLHSFGPAVSNSYVVHFILKGKGFYYIDGEKYQLQAGDVFVIEPNVQTFYQADATDPWVYCWMGFQGNRASEFLYELGVNHNHLIHHCDQPDQIEQMISDLLSMKAANAINGFLLQGLLYQFLGTIFQSTGSEIQAPDKALGNEYQYLRKAEEYIRNHYSSGVQVQEIADAIGISRNYLYTLFQKILGISPKKYLTNFCISKASDLLRNSEESIEAIATACGYQNTTGFIEVFREMTRMTPLQYRKKMRGVRMEQQHPTWNKYGSDNYYNQ